MVSQLPRERAFDSTIALLREGYCFFPRRVARHGPAFETRLLLEKVICLHGPDAVDLLYDETYFHRSGALPGRVKHTLMGHDGVQTLDGAAHAQRKAMFMQLMQPQNREHFRTLLQVHLSKCERKWRKKKQVALHKAFHRILCHCALQWAGLELPKQTRKVCAYHMAQMVDGFGGIGSRYWSGRWARLREEWRFRRIIRQIRSGARQSMPDCPASIIAHYRDEMNALLPEKVAAVELLNLIRPITAIATYIAYAAKALHDFPEEKEKLYEDADYALPFVQEVRRYYPFTPFLGARANRDFEWNGISIKEEQLVVIDIYGLLHDRTLWDDPETFRPERFIPDAMPQSQNRLIPQGGGEFGGHRCAGEWLTREVMQMVVLWLSQQNYTLPEQDLSVDLSRIPAFPKSGVRIQMSATGESL